MALPLILVVQFLRAAANGRRGRILSIAGGSRVDRELAQRETIARHTRRRAWIA